LSGHAVATQDLLTKPFPGNAEMDKVTEIKLNRLEKNQEATTIWLEGLDNRIAEIGRDIVQIRTAIQPRDLPWAVRFFLLPLAVAAAAAMVGAVIHLEIQVNNIQKSVNEVQGSLARQNLKTYAGLAPSEFKATLPDLSSSIAVARRQNVRVPSKVVDDLSKQLTATETSASGFWPTAGEFISYRSALTHEDLVNLKNSMPKCVDTQPHPATTARAIQASPDPQTVPLNPAHYDNCRIQLDSPEEDARLSYWAQSVPPQTALVFNHCLVTYNGGIVRLQIHSPLLFENSLWEFSIFGTPPPSGQKVTETLLTSNPNSVQFPAL
jgi:hypothetical protein